VNQHLLKDLTELGLWNEDMKHKLIAHNGSIQVVVGLFCMEHVVQMSCLSRLLQFGCTDPIAHNGSIQVAVGLLYTEQRGGNVVPGSRLVV